MDIVLPTDVHADVNILVAIVTAALSLVCTFNSTIAGTSPLVVISSGTEPDPDAVE